MVMESEKFHDLLSVNWRPWVLDGIIPAETIGLRTREAGGTKLS